MKQCAKCNEWKNESDFRKSSNTKVGLHSYCKLCELEYSREYRKNNRDIGRRASIKYYYNNIEERKKYSREYNKNNSSQRRNIQLIYDFGITLEEYNKLFELQNGRCAICNIHQSELNKSLHVDHNHETGKVRGLLCGKCNHALGLLGERNDLFLSAIEYLGRE